MPLEVLSLGAGVQSSTVLLMSCRGELPKLDAAVFADTQWEPKAVYAHLKWLTEEAGLYDIPVLTATAGNLRADAIRFRREGGRNPNPERRAAAYNASMPLFVRNPDGTQGIINRQCTSEYKIDVVERVIRRQLLGLAKGQRAPAGAVRHWFGISADEVYRKRTSPNRWQTFYYPLIDTLESPRRDTLFGRGYDRRDCLDWFARRYPGRTLPRSACVGCPFHTDAEWAEMRASRPEEWADAVAFDAEIRAADAALQADGTHPALKGRLVGLPYLHRQMVPLDQVVLRPKDARAALQYGMGNECAGVCGV